MPKSSRIIFVIVSIVLAVGSHVADCSPSHIYNANWSSHAKFHTGQTLSFSILLALLTIFFAFRKTNDKTGAVIAAASFASIYWIAQACAIFYPGTAFVDPEFNHPGFFVMGVIPPQLIIGSVELILIGTASWLALRKRPTTDL